MKTQHFDAIFSRTGAEGGEISLGPDTGARSIRKGKCPFTLEPFADCPISRKRKKNNVGKTCPYSLEACLSQDTDSLIFEEELPISKVA